MKRLSQEELLSVLASDGQLAPDGVARAREVLRAGLSDDDQPWFLKLLQGAGGWLASLFFLFGVLAIIYQAEIALTVFGAIVFVVGLSMGRSETQSAFISQISLCSLLCGLGLLIVGIGMMFDSVVIPASLAAIIAAVTVYLVHGWVPRWVMSLTVLAALATCALSMDGAEMIWGIFLICVAGALVKLVICEESNRIRLGLYYSPIVAALYWSLVSLCATQVARRLGEETTAFDLIPGIGFGLLLLIVLRHILKDLGWEANDGRGLGVQGLALGVCASLILAPGAIAAILMMALAIRSQDRVGLGLSIAALLAFGGHFYYDMDHTLLAKSMMLVCAGTLLLFAGTRIRQEAS